VQNKPVPVMKTLVLVCKTFVIEWGIKENFIENKKIFITTC